MLVKLIMVVGLLIAAISPAENWKADAANAQIDFTVEGIFGLVHGHFSGLQATIHFDEKDFSSSFFSASVEAKTVTTGISLRNSDLRNKEEWFNTDKYPTISFKSKKIEKSAKGYRAIGELTIKGITKSVEIPFVFSRQASTGVFKGEFTLLRMDYRLGNPGGSVGSTVTIALTVPVKENNN
jgi:polyisoprenoid-binding protein YceI